LLTGLPSFFLLAERFFSFHSTEAEEMFYLKSGLAARGQEVSIMRFYQMF